MGTAAVKAVKTEKPPILSFAGKLVQHPFLSAAVVCLFCIAFTTESLMSVVGGIIAEAALLVTLLITFAKLSEKVEPKYQSSYQIHLGIISVFLSILFGLIVKNTESPQLMLLNTGLPLLLLIAICLWSKKLLSVKTVILLMMAAGFLMRLAFVMTFRITQYQHDVGSIQNMDGHLGYIAYFVYEAKLPDFDVRNVYQFYHPPLHHLLANLWVRLQVLMGIDAESAFENIHVLTLFYSSICMIIAYKIFRFIGLHGKGLAAAFAIIAFCPTFFFLGGSINNDVLSITLMLAALLNTLYWYKSRSLPRILCIAVCVGCAMMAKLSGWMIAPAIAFVFIYVFFKEIRQFKKYLMQYITFLVVCVPLALWWEIRNAILYQVPLTYVMLLSEKSSQYIGNIPVLKRLFDFSPFQFETFGPQFKLYKASYNEYNPLIALFKTSVSEELFTVKRFPTIAGIDAVLFWSAVLLGLIGFAAMLYVFISDRKMDFVQKTCLEILYGTVLICYYVFCIKFPHVCTQNIRYAVPLIVIGAFYIGRAVSLLWHTKRPRLHSIRKPVVGVLLALVGVYSVSSVVVYELIMISSCR